jgi:hypothetical protein
MPLLLLLLLLLLPPLLTSAAGHVITQCNTGRMPDGSQAAVVK